MTVTGAHELERRPGRTSRTMASSLGYALLRAASQRGSAGTAGDAWEKQRARYRTDPAAYAREKLGVELWNKQVEILEAARDHKRVAVRSGHKVSKSHTAAVLALWFYDCFDDARVVISCVTARQVDAIIWREVRKMRSRAKDPIAGDMHELARSGFKAADFREIVGFTAKEAEAVAGVSGANLLYLLDEASGIPDAIFEAIEGNRAGGARVVMFSNPTQTTGEFFEAFHAKKEFYRCVHISSEETPNALTGREVVPGLAGHEWIEEKKREWGTVRADGSFEPGPLYLVRVRGEFVVNETGRTISLHTIQQAEERWHGAADSGRLNIGIDPAGPGQGGDESAFAIRRGKKIIDVVALRGLTPEAHLVHLLGIIKAHRIPREPPPVVKVDQDGPVGWSVYSCLRAHEDNAKNETEKFEVVGVRSGERAFRNPDRFGLVRDELWWNLAEWLRDDGAVPEDVKLAKELHAPLWKQDGPVKLRLTPKSELRKILDRSPDRADACALAVWESAIHRETSGRGTGRKSARDEDVDTVPEIGPYGGAIDPYGGVM